MLRCDQFCWCEEVFQHQLPASKSRHFLNSQVSNYSASNGPCMPPMLAMFILLFFQPLAKVQPRPSKSVVMQIPQPLELRLTEPLKWENGCLRVSLELVNRSENPFFLPAT